MGRSLTHSLGEEVVEVAGEGTAWWTEKTLDKWIPWSWLSSLVLLMFSSRLSNDLIWVTSCDGTCGGDMSPFWVRASEGDSWGTALRGESWLVSWSGDRASLLSSSKDELSPPAPFGESVKEDKYLQIHGRVAGKTANMAYEFWNFEKLLGFFLRVCYTVKQSSLVSRLPNSDDSFWRSYTMLYVSKQDYVQTSCCAISVTHFITGRVLYVFMQMQPLVTCSVCNTDP